MFADATRNGCFPRIPSATGGGRGSVRAGRGGANSPGGGGKRVFGERRTADACGNKEWVPFPLPGPPCAGDGIMRPAPSATHGDSFPGADGAAPSLASRMTFTGLEAPWRGDEQSRCAPRRKGGGSVRVCDSAARLPRPRPPTARGARTDGFCPAAPVLLESPPMDECRSLPAAGAPPPRAAFAGPPRKWSRGVLGSGGRGGGARSGGG